MGTFHLSYREYVVIPLNWTTIIGLRFGRKLISTKFVSFADACKLLGIAYPLTRVTKRYFGPTEEP